MLLFLHLQVNHNRHLRIQKNQIPKVIPQTQTFLTDALWRKFPQASGRERLTTHKQRILYLAKRTYSESCMQMRQQREHTTKRIEEYMILLAYKNYNKLQAQHPEET